MAEPDSADTPGTADGAFHPPPIDQQPVDQQPVAPRPTDAVPSRGPTLPGSPELPTGTHDGPAMAARPAGQPLIPPLETTSPVDFVETPAEPVLGAPPLTQPAEQPAEPSHFEPLRTDPPPRLVATWWLRTALLTTMLAAPAATLWVEYRSEPGDVVGNPLVGALHLAALGLLIVWSLFAMRNAGAIVPPSRYQRRSSGVLATALWLLAAAAPIGVVAANRRLEDRLADPEDLAAIAIMAGIVLLAFVLIWLPFRYHARQATRIGAPHRAMLSWFFAPLLAAVGGILAVSVGLGDMLAEDGLDDAERVVQLGVAYGLPMLVFALSTWKAVTVFDEVIDIRWRRWKSEWEQTIDSFADQPAPGPEDSPSIDGLLGS